jgi:hypothetical protein
VAKFSITTASPGLILAVLGTLLLLATLVTHSEIEVKDAPLYTQAWFAPPQMPQTERPQPLPEAGNKQDGKHNGEDILRRMEKKYPPQEEPK